MPDREKVITEIEDALSENLAKVGHVYGMSLYGLKDKALNDALALLKEQPDVVRCSSCVFYHSGACGLHSERMKPEGYCSWGVSSKRSVSRSNKGG